ncbi:MAG TPA: hypothetical protein VN789_14595 [Casimicrobiaceae bacterium]|nr:hypothetical protein [Casimicrobiaceae bacterium]
MADPPDAKALLEVARETLVALVPRADARHQYTLRMIASAMAIATREIAAPVPAVDESAADAALLARVSSCPAHDVAAQRALHAELVAATRAKVAITDPRALA